jgi:hypothetical protein
MWVANGLFIDWCSDSVQMLVAATRLMRSKCENATDSATLNKYLRQVSVCCQNICVYLSFFWLHFIQFLKFSQFNGVTGPFSIQSGGNDRTGFDLYMVINVVDTSFVTVHSCSVLQLFPNCSQSSLL